MDELEQIRQKIDIVSLIQEYLPLKKAGRNFRINCPFHTEKTPSFTVSPERQIFHCFGCGVGGDIFTFLMKYENIEFTESLRILASRAGVELKKQIFDSKTSKIKEKIYQINHLTCEFYHYLLTRHPSGKKALSYLKNRGIKEGSVKAFKLGFVPNVSASLIEFLVGKKKYTMRDLMDSGLIVSGRDRFRNRIMFPLSDHRDNIVGFSGRILEEAAGGQAKYINTPETLVYRKGDLFYGLDKAKDAIKKDKQALIVEGEFDVISCFQNGINNAVAIKGTALTENQANLIRRFTDKVSLCLDQDAAGEVANKRGIEILETANLYISIVKLPSAKDPDESLRENPALFKKAIKAPLPIYDFIIESALSHSDPRHPLGKRKISEEVVPFFAKITNEIVKDHYIKKLARALEVSAEAVALEIEKISKAVSTTVQSVKRDKKDREETLVEYLLALIIQSPSLGTFAEKLTPEVVTLPLYQKIFTYLKEFTTTHKFSIKKFVQFVPAELVPAIDRSYLLVLSDDLNEERYTAEVEKTLNELHTISLRKKLRGVAEKIKIAEAHKNEKELDKLQGSFKKLTSELNIAFRSKIY